MHVSPFSFLSSSVLLSPLPPPPPSLECTTFLLSSYPLFRFIFRRTFSYFPLSILIFILSLAVSSPSLIIFLLLAKCIVERDRVSNQEIALVSSKLSAPRKIEVALIKKEETKVKPRALLEGSLFSRRLCTCHPDSIPAFFSRKRTADKNPPFDEISVGNVASRYIAVKSSSRNMRISIRSVPCALAYL